MGERPRRQDLAWIEKNRDIFWLSATTAFEEIGRGVLLVDLRQVPSEGDHSFSYRAEGELEGDRGELKGILDGYDPGREFIVVLQKPESSHIYLGRRPDIGWMADIKTKTQYTGYAPREEGAGEA